MPFCRVLPYTYPFRELLRTYKGFRDRCGERRPKDISNLFVVVRNKPVVEIDVSQIEIKRVFAEAQSLSYHSMALGTSFSSSLFK